MAVLVGLCWAQAAGAAEVYYVLVFGSQQVPPRAKYSHSFATFVKATGEGPSVETYALKTHTISWMPQTLDICVHALLPECGKNLDLPSTIRWVLATDQRLSMWGPYQIDKELYCRAMEQICFLESGRVRYKAVDTGWSNEVASNCIHAVDVVVRGNRLRVLSTSFGETASFYLTERMEPWIIDCRCRHDWVSDRLGLKCYPIVRRELENPRTSVFWSALGAARGRNAEGGGGPE